MRCARPPWPTVQSRYWPPDRHRSQVMTSAARTGICEISERLASRPCFVPFLSTFSHFVAEVYWPPTHCQQKSLVSHRIADQTGLQQNLTIELLEPRPSIPPIFPPFLPLARRARSRAWYRAQGSRGTGKSWSEAAKAGTIHHRDPATQGRRVTSTRDLFPGKSERMDESLSAGSSGHRAVGSERVQGYSL